MTPNQPDSHHFIRRLIECSCGRTFDPTRFQKHVRDQALNDLTQKMRPLTRAEVER